MRRKLWSPSEELLTGSKMADFERFVNEKYGMALHGYSALYQWSVDWVQDFWSALWHYFDIKAERKYTAVVDDPKKMPGAVWFSGSALNYAENILRYTDTLDGDALVFRGENAVVRRISWKALRSQVVRLAASFRTRGIQPGDVIAGYMPNLPETVIAMLAASAVGAVWCSCATDIGADAAVERLGQTNPKILFTVDGYLYKNKVFDVCEKAARVKAGIQTLETVVVCHYAGSEENARTIPDSIGWDAFLADEPESFRFEQMDGCAPLVIMFSSGTTGKPKCMVQSAAGLLLNQLKEIVLHHDIRPGDRMLYITTCSWMMWNWQLAALGAGCTLILYDGNPTYPDAGAIWRILEQERATVLGLSASYIHMLLSEGFSPKAAADLSALREISQTGSALSDEGFEYVYREIKPDIFFNSIAGGTDINGCFCIANPLSDVYSGELQAPGLGMKIKCYDPDGNPIVDAQGELVCEQSAPSMPLYFWNDPDGKRYMDAYFREFPGIWRHGDYVLFHGDTGGVTYCGRSDSVLKPSGVRIGTAEIYNEVEKLPQIEESLAVGQQHCGDQRVILFVKLKEGFPLDGQLRSLICSNLRKNASPRHVPAVILECPDIPHTLNGKKVESAVTNIVNGRDVTNRDALANPKSLEYFREILPTLQ